MTSKVMSLETSNGRIFAQIKVEDTGKGFSIEDQYRLFKPLINPSRI